MTSTSISRQITTPTSRRRSLRADLAFWTAAGAVVAALSGPLAHSWQVSRTVLLVGGLSFAVFGPVLLLGLNRMRHVSRGLVAALRGDQFPAGTDHRGSGMVRLAGA